MEGPAIPEWSVKPIDENTLNVSWGLGFNSSLINEGLLHVIEYRRHGEDDLIDTIGQTDLTWQAVSNLTAGILYEFRVVAMDGDLQAASEWKEVMLSPAAIARKATLATWFIVMMVVIAVLIFIMIIVCIVKRNREARYHVQEEGLPNGNEDNDENDKTVSNGDKGSEVSGSDSLEDYGKVDSLKFNEEGSIIGQSGSQELKEAS